jgi:hypothetical protein
LPDRGALDSHSPLPAPALVVVALVTIVTIAVLSTPVPFRAFINDPPNLLPSTFPYIWLPTFLVQAALFGHLMIFRAIRRYDAR